MFMIVVDDAIVSLSIASTNQQRLISVDSPVWKLAAPLNEFFGH